jgi:cell division protein FtsN
MPMARDYRKTRPNRPSRRYEKSAKTGSSSGFKWAVIGILIGAAIAIFWQYAPHHAFKMLEASRQKPETKNHANPNPADSQAHTPQFDFYTVLPKMQVEQDSSPAPSTTPAQPIKPPAVAASATSTPATPNPITDGAITPPAVATTTAPPAPTTAKSATPEPKSAKLPPQNPTQTNADRSENYLLQVASVKDYSEADRLKAQLSMLGFNVSIQKTTVNGQAWNRVYVGPFSSKQQALEKQQNLRENNVSSMMIKQ